MFFDGWSPEYPVIDDLDDELTLPVPSNVSQVTSVSMRRHGGVGSQYTTEYEYDPKYNPPSSPGLQDFITTRSEISVDSTVVDTQHVAGAGGSVVGGHSVKAWVDDLQERNARIVQATHPRTANNDKELTVNRSEYLEVRLKRDYYQSRYLHIVLFNICHQVLDDSRKWWKCRNIRGHVGHVPHTIIVPFNYNDIVVYNTQQIPNYGRSAGRPNRGGR